MVELKMEIPEKSKSTYVLQETFAGKAMVGLCQNESKEQCMEDFKKLIAFCDELNNRKVVAKIEVKPT